LRHSAFIISLTSCSQVLLSGKKAKRRVEPINLHSPLSGEVFPSKGLLA
jgi:hypothetical protein